MATANPIKIKIKQLKEDYDKLKKGKESLLKMIDEVELPESVYNSNAIENSKLTLKETEKILLEMELSRNVSLREVYEAKNLARVMEYIRLKSKETEVSEEMILLLHRILIENIDEEIAGRFRKQYEYVQVGSYIAPAPEHISRMIESIIIEYTSNHVSYFLDRIAQFHLDFENIHPFNDGNGRIGRVIINFQLIQMGYPTIIIREKEKKEYYRGFAEYREKKNKRVMERVIGLAIIESFHKRIAYLKGQIIITLIEYAKKIEKPAPVILNMASRQTIPAFREKGIWKIGELYDNNTSEVKDGDF